MSAREDMSILGQIVSANVDALAWTNDKLHDIEKAQTLSYAQAFSALYDAIAKIPDFARPARLDRVLDAYGWAREGAERLIEGGAL